MADVTELLRAPAEPINQRSVVEGFVSTERPAPTGFTKVGSEENFVYVIIPSYSTTVPYGPCNWAALHGSTIPVHGTRCLMGFSEANKPVIVWWEGEQSSVSNPVFVSELPAEPTNGELVYYQQAGGAGPSEMEKEGVVWALRYRSTSASPYKWECVGGGTLSPTPSGTMKTSTTPEAALTGGPTITVPLTGEYDTGLSIFIALEEAGPVEALVKLRKNGVAAALLVIYISTAITDASTLTATERTTLAAADVLTIGTKIEQTIKTLFSTGKLSITPVRVG